MSHRIDRTGQTFGLLTFITFSHMYKGTGFWLCRCVCGKEKILRSKDVISGSTKSCGDSIHHIKSIVNQRFNKLLVISFSHCSKHNKAHWLCQCDCGNKCIVSENGLQRNTTTSCGCNNTYTVTYDIDINTGCHNCTSHMLNKGYPVVFRNNKQTHLVRYLFINAHPELLENGSLPIGSIICHTCDNTRCINLNHVYLGSTQSNMDDKVNRNRQSKGEGHVFAKLNESQVEDVLINKHITIDAFAKYYNVSQSTIGAIRRGVHWKHLSRNDFLQGSVVINSQSTEEIEIELSWSSDADLLAKGYVKIK